MKNPLLLFFILISALAQSQDTSDTITHDVLSLYDSLYTSVADSIVDPLEYMQNIEVFDKSEYLIPSAPAFALLGVTPEMVTRPGVVRDFKVDWRIKNYQIAPDFALEAQPLWLLHFNKKGLAYYAKSSKFMQALSTLSISLGTAKLDGVNHFSYAAKVTVFREKDPLKDKSLIRELFMEEYQDRIEIEQAIEGLKSKLSIEKDRVTRQSLKRQIELYQLHRRDIMNRSRDKMQEITDRHASTYWNASSVDVSFGRVFTFNNNAADDMFINKAGYAFWVNGALRAGRRGLIGGLVKLKKVGGLSESMVGANFRYGGGRFSFYTELVAESKFDRTADFVNIEDPFSNNFSEDLGISWITPIDHVEKQNVYTIAYGGDFRLSRGILLNFALRTQFQEDLSFNKLIPVANLTCLMR